jgi:hypothetical protein
MEKATIEITKEEAALLPLLYKVPLDLKIEAAPQAMRLKLQIDALVQKVQKAFEKEG